MSDRPAVLIMQPHLAPLTAFLESAYIVYRFWEGPPIEAAHDIRVMVVAGEAALDPCWRMPLDDEYAEGLKTNFADVANVAGRQAGSVTAAKFLQRFAKKYPWAHLDIAGVAWEKKGGANWVVPKGAVGFGVRLLNQFILEYYESK